MIILFEDKGKKFKSTFLKELENNIKILKNIYDEVYINNEGIGYSIESKLENGRVFCNTTIHKLFDIDDRSLLKLNLKSINDCIKAGKTKIIGYSVDNELIFKTTEMDYRVGVFEHDMKLNIDYLIDIVDNIDYKCNLNELIERFANKEFINIKKDKYDLILTHKLFPSINKSCSFDFGAKVNNNGTFYGVFKNMIEERNKKDEITFSMIVTYVYRFLDLN